MFKIYPINIVVSCKIWFTHKTCYVMLLFTRISLYNAMVHGYLIVITCQLTKKAWSKVEIIILDWFIKTKHVIMQTWEHYTDFNRLSVDTTFFGEISLINKNIEIKNRKNTRKYFIQDFCCVLLFCVVRVVLSVCYCMGHFVIVFCLCYYIMFWADNGPCIYIVVSEDLKGYSVVISLM